jgi:F420-non-reducing hydrogenase iron-sulfur subunit
MQRLRNVRGGMPERRYSEPAFYDQAAIGAARRSVGMSFEPKIVGFLCNWCSYAGADLAGTSRKKYPPNVRVVRVMCSGRVEPTLILKAFERGADGVLVCG